MKIVSRVQPMITSPVKLHIKSQVTGQDDQSMEGESVQSANAVSGSGTALPVGTLEKSKSDSKLNQSTKKAKSFSKFSELDKEICPLPRYRSINNTVILIRPGHTIKYKKAENKKISPQLSLKIKKSRPQELPVSNRDISNSVLLCALESKDTVKDKKNIQNPTKEPQFMCDNQESSSDEFSILEKCIRQYEVFFEVYLERKVLQINVQRTAYTVTVKVETDLKSNAPPNVENIFKNEEVYEDVCVERVLEIDRYFETLQVNMMCRSKQLHQLLSRSLIST